MVRVTSNMMTSRVLENIQRASGSMYMVQNALTTGRKFSRVQDDPIAYIKALDLRRELSENRQFQDNLSLSKTTLDLTESTLASINEQLQSARHLALQGSNGAISNDSRGAVADEIEQILDSVIELANSNFDGRYIFSGEKTLNASFKTITGADGTVGVIYAGDTGDRIIEIGSSQTMAIGLTGLDAFFTSLNRITSDAGVDPGVLLSTELATEDPPLTALAGTFTVDGVTINFDPATDTLESLRDSINRSVDTAEASIDETGHLTITSLTSNDVTLANGTSNVLETLGMFHQVKGVDVGAGITSATTLASLGMTGDAIRITVGDEAYDVDLAGAVTVGDVISAVSASGAPVQAFINSAGTGISFSATESVDSLEVTSVRKIFGSTALASGSVTLDTTLASLGIAAPGGLQITNDGVTTTVNLADATTVADVLNAINEQVNGVTATLNADGTGLNLESAYFSGGLSAVDVGPSTIATVLGFSQTRNGDSAADLGVTEAGTVNETESQNVFKSLTDLISVLRSSSPTSEDFDEVLGSFDTDLTTVLSNRSIIGARTNRIEASQTRFEAFETYLTQLLSDNEDTDLAEAITDLATQSNILDAALAAGAKLLQTSLIDFLR
jgi:flagellar hook-associated protein 3 FlgL